MVRTRTANRSHLIASDGTLGGNAGGLEIKAMMLRLEKDSR